MAGWNLAPAVLFLALAAAIWWVTRRWWDRLPLPELLLSLALPFALFGPALTAGGVLLPTDQLGGWVPFGDLPDAAVHGNYLQYDLLVMIAPARTVAREAVADGRWPLWNDRVASGMPLLADPQAQVAQPIVVAGAGMDLAGELAVAAASKVWLAFVFTWWLLRRQELDRGPAVLGALSWSLGGFVLLWVGWPIGTSAVWLPAVVYGLVLLRQEGRARDAVLLTMTLVGLLLGGHPETIGYVAVVAATVGAALGTWAGAEEWRRFAARAVGAAIVAGLVVAPVLLPTSELLPRSVRAAQLESAATQASLVEWPARTVGRWLPIVAPNASGNDRYLEYWGPENTNEDASGFVGTAAVALALLALVGRRRVSQELVFGALGVSAAVLLTGIPGLDRVAAVVAPMLRSPTDHHRLLLVVGFALCYLAAASAQRLEWGDGSRWAPAAVAAVLGLSTWAWYTYGGAPGDPERLDPLRWGSAVWAWRSLAVVAVVGTVGHGRRGTSLVVAAVVVLELFAVHGPANPSAAPETAYPPSPALAWAADETVRVVGGEGVAPPNVLSAYGLRDARLRNPAAPADLVAFVARAEAGDDAALDRLAVSHRLLAPEARRLGDDTSFADSRAAFVRRAEASPLVATPSGRVEVELSEPERLILVDPGGGDLLISVTADGGWRLVTDGRPAVTDRADDGPFVRATVPVGTARAELVYRPRSFVVGCLLAALGLAALWVTALPAPPGREPDLAT